VLENLKVEDLHASGSDKEDANIINLVLSNYRLSSDIVPVKEADEKQVSFTDEDPVPEKKEKKKKKKKSPENSAEVQIVD